jgi:hypothetical protein
VPANTIGDLDFAQQNASASPAELDAAAQLIRTALAEG